MNSGIKDILVLLPTWEQLWLLVKVSRVTSGVLQPEGQGGHLGRAGKDDSRNCMWEAPGAEVHGTSTSL